MRASRALGLVCLLSAAGCAAEIPPTPDDCVVVALDERIVVGFEPRLRILVLRDARTPLPDDVDARLAEAERALRTGDFDGVATGRDFRPIADLTLTERAYDPSAPLIDAIAPDVPQGYGARATSLAVVLLTGTDISAAQAGEADALVAPFDDAWQLAFLGVAPTTEGTELARLAGALVDAGVEAGTARFDEGWQRDLVRTLVLRTSSWLSSPCLPHEIPRLGDGLVPCTLTETLDPEAPFACSDLPGRSDDPSDPAHRRCLVAQVTGSSGSGWYYDDITSELCAATGLIAYTDGVTLSEGSVVRLSCVMASEGCDR